MVVVTITNTVTKHKEETIILVYVQEIAPLYEVSMFFGSLLLAPPHATL